MKRDTAPVDPAIAGVLYECSRCGSFVRLYGDNDVTSWLCEACRRPVPYGERFLDRASRS